MAIETILDDDSRPSEADKVQELLEKHAAKLKEVRIGRPGKANAQNLLQRFRWTLNEGDDAARQCHELAGMIIDVAENDAGGKRKRYLVALIGDALSVKHDPPTLDTITIRAGDDDAAPRATDVMNTHARDIGERHLRLLDVTLGSLERIAPIAALAEERERAASTADAQVKIHCANLEMQDRRELREAKASQELQGFILGMSQQYGKLIDAIATYTRARADKIMADLREKKAPPPRARKKRAKARARKAAAT